MQVPFGLSGRRAIATAAAGVLLLGGSVAGIGAVSQAAGGPVASSAADRAAALEQAKAEIVAASREEVLADGGKRAEEARALLLESEGKVEDGLRSRLSAEIDALERAVAAGDHGPVLVAMTSTRDVVTLTRNAIRAHDVAAGRAATGAEQARLVTEAEAAQAAAEQERLAGEAKATQEAARAAATEAAASTLAAQQATAAASEAAEAPPVAAPRSTPTQVPLELTLSGMLHMRGIWFDTPGGSKYSTLLIDETTGSCAPASSAFADIGSGAQVTVYDDQGDVIATTALSNGVPTVLERVQPSGIFSGHLIGECSWAFTATVPDRPFYQVEVTHRGKVAVGKVDVADVRLFL